MAAAATAGTSELAPRATLMYSLYVPHATASACTTRSGDVSTSTPAMTTKRRKVPPASPALTPTETALPQAPGDLAETTSEIPAEASSKLRVAEIAAGPTTRLTITRAPPSRKYVSTAS